MSKQLSLSAAFAVFAMAAFALYATPGPASLGDLGAPANASAPELQASLNGL